MAITMAKFTDEDRYGRSAHKLFKYSLVSEMTRRKRSINAGNAALQGQPKPTTSNSSSGSKTSSKLL